MLNNEVVYLFLRTLKLSVQKMKFLLKKFLEFEKLHGTPASIAAVKSRAQSFVESKIT